MRTGVYCGLLVALSAIGCAAAVPSTQPAQGPSPAPVSGPPQPWAQMDWDSRRDYMLASVVPTMEPLFMGHDGEEFGDFGCATCHGADASQRRYAMPNPGLPTLYPTGSPEQQATVAEHRQMATFMFQEVTPHMRDLLGAEQYDPQTGRGFSCFYCHPKGDSTQP